MLYIDIQHQSRKMIFTNIDAQFMYDDCQLNDALISTLRIKPQIRNKVLFPGDPRILQDVVSNYMLHDSSCTALDFKKRCAFELAKTNINRKIKEIFNKDITFLLKTHSSIVGHITCGSLSSTSAPWNKSKWSDYEIVASGESLPYSYEELITFLTEKNNKPEDIFFKHSVYDTSAPTSSAHTKKLIQQKCIFSNRQKYLKLENLIRFLLNLDLYHVHRRNMRICLIKF